MPGVRFGALYAPDSSVVRGREDPLCTSKIVTVAPVTAPPLASVMVPTMRPVLPCENAEAQSTSIASVAPNRCSTLLLFDELMSSHPFFPRFTPEARRQMRCHFLSPSRPRKIQARLKEG